MSRIIDLGKLRFHFAGAYSSSTQYETNDVVKYGGNVYVYTYPLKAAGVLPTDTSRWALMVEGFNFIGVFSTTVNYKVGDAVAHGGVVYVAVTDSYGITPPNPTYWSRFLDGIQYEGEYNSTTPYQKNDVVNYGGSIYVAKQDTTNNLPTNTTFWAKFVEGISPRGVYNSGTAYVPNDLVAYGANIYRAKIETTGNPPSNTTYWELYVGGFKFLGTYNPVTEYYVNDLVVYGNTIYRSRDTQTAIVPTNTGGWELLIGGLNYAGSYNALSTYYINDIVVYGNNSYRSLVTQTGVLPTTLGSNWVLYVSTTNYRGEYSNATTYYQGDLVNYGGNVYLALNETVGNLPTATGTGENNWQIYSAGFSYQGSWSSTTSYKISQVVNYGGSLYIATEDNVDVNPTDTGSWDKIVSGIQVVGPWETSAEYAVDVVVTYGGNTYISLLPHASGNFNTDLAAGKWQKFNSGIRWRGSWSSGTQYYADDVVKFGTSSYIADEDVIGGPNPGSFETGVLNVWTPFATGAEGLVSRDGDSMTGFLTLNANPTDPLHAAPKQYVDLFINAASGGTILGPLVADGIPASYTAQNGATITIDEGSLSLTNGSTLSIDGTSSLGAVTIDGDVTLTDGADLITDQVSISVFNTTATTVNAFGAATTLELGAATGTTNINNSLDVDGDLNIDGGDLTVSTATFNLANSTATTVNAFGAATTLELGAATGTTNINNNLDVDGDLNIDGGDLTVSASVFNLADTTATTINAFGAATNIDIGASTGTVSIRNASVVLDGVLNTDASGTTYTLSSMDPTGFDNQNPNTRGIIEFSDDGNRIYSVDTAGAVTVREGTGLAFAAGTAYETAVAAKTLVIFPAPGQASFVYYQRGIKYNVTTLKSVSLGSIDGRRYFYFNGATLVSTTNRTDAILTQYANVASVYGSTENEKIVSFADERHGISIDGATLAYVTRTDDAQLISGFGINATAGSDTYTSTKAGEFRNADLTVVTPVKTGNKFLSRIGTEWQLADFDDLELSYKLGILSGVTVVNAGSGYFAASTTFQVVGDGFGATVSPVYVPAPISSVVLDNGGSNYADTTTAAIAGDGTGAILSVVVPAGKNVDTITLTNAGDGYTNVSATVVGSGTGATVSTTLNLGTPIAAATVTSLGSGYSAGTTTVTINGDGTGATATATVVAGAVTDINITNGGSGYTTASVVITGAGTGAAATAFPTKSTIVDYEITNVGSGYTTASVVITGDGQGATATATVTAGGVTDITITNAGYGYTTAAITINGDGSGATAVPKLSGYPIQSITLTNIGKNYLTAPSIVFTENGLGVVDNPATASTTLKAGNTIESITLTNAGIGYTTASAVLSDIGGGTGAQITTTTSSSGIQQLNVTAGGQQYSYADIVVTSPTGSGAVFSTTLLPVPQYNNLTTGGYNVSNLPSGKFTAIYLLASDSVDRVVKIPSSYYFDSISEAFQNAKTEIDGITEFGLPYDNYIWTGFYIVDSDGELQTVNNTNQGNVTYYDLTESQINDIPVGVVDRALGKVPTISGIGNNVLWTGPTESDKVYYVAPHGVDSPVNGDNLATPFASVRYACSQAVSGSTIFVKTGTYVETQLPIVVPANVAIVGDNQRTTIITAGGGLAADGITPNNESTMFLMSNGSILNKMTFTGMTGWVPGGTAADVTTSTIKGVVVRLNPASPITTKSPYVLECSFIGSGGIGALIDGSVHATGAKTMIFHGYTIISDNGIGYWVKDGGKAEIVSCFTYYCYFGYTASGGGFIRALNGNNSYGTWGCTSRGFDASETPLTGTVFGQELNFLYTGGNINVGDTVTGPTGSATVTNAQLSGSSNKLYVSGATGTFTLGQELTTTGGGTGVVSAGALRDQRGFIIIGTGFASIPIPGQSITLSDDSISYVIQSVSGTYVNSSSRMVLVFAQEKPTGSANDAGITLRSKFSQIRLTGHDFLDIGTGGTVTTNYPGTPTQPPAQGNEVDEAFPGRVYYVSTDQNGNFRVGEYFRIDQATGTATLNANAFNLAGLTSLRLGSIGAQLGETINEFSSDGTLSGNSNTAVPTEQAVKTYVDTELAISNYTESASNVYNAAGRPTTFIEGDITYQNITYTSNQPQIIAPFNNLVSSYQEVIAGVTKTVTVTYNVDGTINQIVVT